MKTAAPLSRRRFVTTAAAVGAGALACRSIPLRAADRALSDVSFLVITDTHLGYQDKDAAEKQWLKTAAELARAPGAFVLHLGDVVDGGREPQYARYLEGRKLIGKTVHEIPGNHDPQELFERHLRKDVNFAFEHEWLRVLLINNSRTESHDGFITPEQLAWLGAQCALAAKADQRLLFAMHVPVHTNAAPDRGWHVKPAHGQREFYALLEKHATRTIALFHGHFHNGLRGWDDRAPVHEISFPSALYNLDRKLAAKPAPGYNLPEFRPGFTRVRVRDSVLELAYQPVGVAEPATKQLSLKPA